eukprot:1536494-Prymnesium_polylepis.1
MRVHPSDAAAFRCASTGEKSSSARASAKTRRARCPVAPRACRAAATTTTTCHARSGRACRDGPRWRR